MININLMPKPCKLYLGKREYIDFGRYDNPEKARHIMKKYFSGLVNVTEEGVQMMNGIVSGNKTCIDLDLALDVMFSRCHKVVKYPHIQYGGGGGSLSDPDADGSWGNAVRTYEEKENKI